MQLAISHYRACWPRAVPSRALILMPRLLQEEALFGEDGAGDTQHFLSFALAVVMHIFQEVAAVSAHGLFSSGESFTSVPRSRVACRRPPHDDRQYHAESDITRHRLSPAINFPLIYCLH